MKALEYLVLALYASSAPIFAGIQAMATQVAGHNNNNVGPKTCLSLYRGTSITAGVPAFPGANFATFEGATQFDPRQAILAVTGGTASHCDAFASLFTELYENSDPLLQSMLEHTTHAPRFKVHLSSPEYFAFANPATLSPEASIILVYDATTQAILVHPDALSTGKMSIISGCRHEFIHAFFDSFRGLSTVKSLPFEKNDRIRVKNEIKRLHDSLNNTLRSISNREPIDVKFGMIFGRLNKTKYLDPNALYFNTNKATVKKDEHKKDSVLINLNGYRHAVHAKQHSVTPHGEHYLIEATYDDITLHILHYLKTQFDTYDQLYGGLRGQVHQDFPDEEKIATLFQVLEPGVIKELCPILYNAMQNLIATAPQEASQFEVADYMFTQQYHQESAWLAAFKKHKDPQKIKAHLPTIAMFIEQNKHVDLYQPALDVIKMVTNLDSLRNDLAFQTNIAHIGIRLENELEIYELSNRNKVRF